MPKKPTTYPLPDLDEMTPAMRALKREAHRVFAWNYANNGGDAAEAALAAGSGKDFAPQNGWRLKQRDDIQAAILELNDKNLAGLGSLAIKSLHDVVNDPNHKGHMKAIELALDRSGLTASEKRPARNDNLSDEQILARIVALATKYNFPLQDVLGASAPLAKRIKGPVIEAEVLNESMEDLF